MNENKDEKTTGYTGEYGNPIEGEYKQKEESTYSYSYKNGDGAATHSGDYYAHKDQAASDAEKTASESAATANSTTSAESSNNTTQNSGYQSAGWQNTAGANQNGYGNQYYQNGANQNVTGKPKKDKKPLSLGQKIAVTAACAVMFGTIAGVCFNGVNYAADRFLPAASSSQKTLSKTTESTGKTTTSSANTTVSTESSTDVVTIAEQTMPAVVAITSTTKAQDYYDLFGQYYEGQETTGSGTGFIVGQNEKELLIATNNHVIDGAKTISIKCIDGEIYEAVEKGSDTANDLAVIAVKLSDIKEETMEQIKIADLGSSDDAKVGEKVIAIGNALGYGQSVTVGYISAKDREITETTESGGTTKIKAIQTDAAINPGNSGGALINMQGQVIGINSAKIADSSVEGVGYAIPISAATPIIDELMNREILEDSEKGYLGITGTQVTEAASAYNVPYGVYVKEVAKNGAADKAGIKANDVITGVNKMEVTSMESLQEKVNSYRKGTEIEITLQRMQDGEYVEKKVKVTLQGVETLDDLSTGQSSDNNTQSNEQNKDSAEENNNAWNFFK